MHAADNAHFSNELCESIEYEHSLFLIVLNSIHFSLDVE